MKITTYLDTSGAGLISDEALRVAAKYNQLLTTNMSAAFFSFLENDFPQLKTNMANFIGIAENRLAFVPNFSYGFSMFLTSVKPHKQRVLLFESDYPSLIMPFEMQGFSVTKMPLHDADFNIDYQAIENKIRAENIEILAVSQVQYLTGFVADISALAAICQKYHVLFLVDGTQSLGALPIQFDQSGIDVFMASNYKWMNGGFGSAVTCFAAGVLEKYTPNIAGYGSHHFIDGKMVFKADAKSYEPGHFSYVPYLMLAQAVKEKLAFGLDKIMAHNTVLAQRFLAGISATRHTLVGPETLQNRCSLLVINASEDLHKTLLTNGIKTTFRNNTIRLAFHFTNTNQDVDHILEVLKNN